MFHKNNIHTRSLINKFKNVLRLYYAVGIQKFEVYFKFIIENLNILIFTHSFRM